LYFILLNINYLQFKIALKKGNNKEVAVLLSQLQFCVKKSVWYLPLKIDELNVVLKQEFSDWHRRGE